MELYSYLPIMWRDNKSNGLHGSAVKDAGSIIVYDGDHDSDSFEEIMHQTSIAELINDFIEGAADMDTRKITDPSMIAISIEIKNKLKEAIATLDNSLTK